MKKRMILVTSPPASGKTFVSKQLAKNIPNIVYLDKDALIPLSSQIFKVVGEENNRSSAFFEEHIRNYEYIAILDIAFEALEYADLVLINAPFTREVRDNEYIKNLKEKLASKNAELIVIWVVTFPFLLLFLSLGTRTLDFSSVCLCPVAVPSHSLV